ncbi:MAG: sigma-70 family RNA polymerase sigma factor [Planctomycetia bacterium]|nr:sigma-70 family RNA polymerase sigma factor [Planctomycetia bacterium]
MTTTPISLLERLRAPAEQGAWARFVELYTPLLFHWTRRAGVRAEDAADVVQDVFLVLLEKLPEFTYDRQKSFRGWLRTVLLNKWRDHLRRRGAAAAGGGAAAIVIADDADGTAAFEDAEYRQFVVARAVQLMQTDFQPTTWKACWEHVVCGRSAAEVAAELGVAEGTVYSAKCRVLQRLRKELAGLIED